MRFKKTSLGLGPKSGQLKSEDLVFFVDFPPRYLLYRLVTTNFPPLFYIVAAQKDTLKTALESFIFVYDYNRFSYDCPFYCDHFGFLPQVF